MLQVPSNAITSHTQFVVLQHNHIFYAAKNGSNFYTQYRLPSDTWISKAQFKSLNDTLIVFAVISDTHALYTAETQQQIPETSLSMPTAYRPKPPKQFKKKKSMVTKDRERRMYKQSRRQNITNTKQDSNIGRPNQTGVNCALMTKPFDE